tara:strand:+ start:1967 stop:2749 length:783 start_codon:yes stop_codon:yes gene_type:complete
MKFSILITSYNKRNYIEECIESCLKQNEKNFEVILIDNFSNDGSDIILNKYKNLVKVIKEKRISNYPAINQIDLIKKAFNISTGEIICLLDGDDFFLPEKLEILKKEFINNTYIDVVFDSPLYKSNGKLSKIKIKKKFQKNIWPTIINTSSISMRREFLYECLNKKIFDNYELLEIDFRINLYSRLIKNNFKIIEQPITIYRKVENSIISNIKKFSGIWWIKRNEAHKYMKNLFIDNQLMYRNSIDRLLTKFISKFFIKK